MRLRLAVPSRITSRHWRFGNGKVWAFPEVPYFEIGPVRGGAVDGISGDPSSCSAAACNNGRKVGRPISQEFLTPLGTTCQINSDLSLFKSPISGTETRKCVVRERIFRCSLPGVRLVANGMLKTDRSWRTNAAVYPETLAPAPQSA